MLKKFERFIIIITLLKIIYIYGNTNYFFSEDFSVLLKCIVPRCVFLSLSFCSIMLYPHAMQVHSYPYGENVLRVLCIGCSALFSKISSTFILI